MRYVLGLLLLTLHGCGGILTWQTTYSSMPSDHRAELRVQETNCFGDCEVQIVVKRGWHERQIAHQRDCSVKFAHAAWSGSTVSVFVDGGYCGPIKAAYDVTNDRLLGFESSEPWLRASLVKAYKVTAEELQANNGDVFKWATYPGDGRQHRAMQDYRRR